MDKPTRVGQRLVEELAEAVDDCEAHEGAGGVEGEGADEAIVV